MMIAYAEREFVDRYLQEWNTREGTISQEFLICLVILIFGHDSKQIVQHFLGPVFVLQQYK